MKIAEQRVALGSGSWATYSALAAEASQQRGRMTYDRGVLEIMSPLLSHESAKWLIGRMIERFAEARGIDIRSAGSTTFRRPDLQRGFEADESYYIAGAAAVRGKQEIDLTIDPPPDLVVEIEITRSAVEKQSLLAAMGIAELWRYDGRAISIGCLAGEAYTTVHHSRALPGFPLELAETLLALRAEESETVLIRRFVKEVNEV